jgi:cold shock CspA family protein
MRGLVVEFDVERGLGTIESDAGDRVIFHCTQIADGSRVILVGADVTYELLAKLGRYEATAITVVASAAAD